MTTVDQVIAAYRTLRSQKEEIEERHKAELAPIKENMNKCLAWIQNQLQTQNLTNFKGKSGIAFLQNTNSVTVQDWPEFYQWVKANDAAAFLERRAALSVVQEYVEANGQLPPGLSMNSVVEVRVRKA
jgi:hypothetical protein